MPTINVKGSLAAWVERKKSSKNCLFKEINTAVKKARNALDYSKKINLARLTADYVIF